MFDQTFVNTQSRTRKPWTVAVSLAAQSAFVLALLIVPLLRIPKLEAPPHTPLWIPLMPAPHRPEPEAKPQPQSQAVRPRRAMPNFLAAPTRVPAHIDMSPEAPSLPDNAAIPVQSSGVLSALTSSSTLPPPRPAALAIVNRPPPPPPATVHVSMGVQLAKLIFGPKPVYPALARAARVQGTVRMRAIISPDGTIRNLQVASGPPLLVQAAIDAVRQWRYRPTTLNSEPVEVETEIDVNFTLSQ